jgi:hypothetical protein
MAVAIVGLKMLGSCLTAHVHCMQLMQRYCQGTSLRGATKIEGVEGNAMGFVYNEEMERSEMGLLNL